MIGSAVTVWIAVTIAMFGLMIRSYELHRAFERGRRAGYAEGWADGVVERFNELEEAGVAGTPVLE